MIHRSREHLVTFSICFVLYVKLNVFHHVKPKDGSLDELIRKRYQSFDSEIGAQIEVTFLPFFSFTPLLL